MKTQQEIQQTVVDYVNAEQAKAGNSIWWFYRLIPYPNGSVKVRLAASGTAGLKEAPCNLSGRGDSDELVLAESVRCLRQIHGNEL